MQTRSRPRSPARATSANPAAPSHGRKPALVVSLGSEGSARHRAGTLWQISAVSWRDMDASVLGVEKGVTPFADQPALIPLPMPFDSIPTATLSTGAAVLAQPSDDAAIDADLVDMETFAVVRAARHFGLPTVGLRAVSDSPRAAGGKEASGGMESWTDRLAHIDALLARAIDQTPTILERVPRPTSG